MHRDISLRQQRDTDLLAVLNTQLGTEDEVWKVIDRTRNHPAKRFYITSVSARRVISLMIKGERLKEMLGLKREMFEEIYKRVVALMAKNNIPLSHAIELVVEQEAPKFYLERKSTNGIISKIRKGRKCQKC